MKKTSCSLDTKSWYSFNKLGNISTRIYIPNRRKLDRARTIRKSWASPLAAGIRTIQELYGISVQIKKHFLKQLIIELRPFKIN